MSKEKYYPPQYAVGEFHCPHCGVYAQQRWSYIYANGCPTGYLYLGTGQKEVFSFKENIDEHYTMSKCGHCYEYSIWFEERIIHPGIKVVEEPNDDLPKEVKADYNEAATILQDSPRAAAALLRLALQKLCKELGEKGENINADIASLVKKGLNPLVKKSLDSLRITGNNAVHPGKINFKEEPEKVRNLFNLINFIAEKMISEPRQIEKFYESLPAKEKKQVERRDKK